MAEHEGDGREHWENVLPYHLVLRSRTDEKFWTPTQFEAEFEVIARIDGGAMLVARRKEDRLKGTLRHDSSGWYYGWTPDYGDDT
jgi:hypothetical protein